MEEKRAEAGPEQCRARGESREDRDEYRRAEHREHVLHAEDAHLWKPERPRVVDRVRALELRTQTRDGHGERRRLVGRHNAVLRYGAEQLLEERDVVVLRREWMDKADEGPCLVYVRLAVCERELLRRRDQLRKRPVVSRL